MIKNVPFRFQKGWSGPEPLQFPLLEVPDGIGLSRLVSPRIGNSHNIDAPTYPEDGSAYNEMVSEVIEVRTTVFRDKWPSDFLAKHHPRPGFDPERIPGPLQYIADLREDELDAKAAAESVVGDHALDVPLGCMKWLLNNGLRKKIKRYDSKGHDEFLGSDIHVTENLSDMLKRTMEKIFAAKYYFGAARIEEFLDVPGGIFTSSFMGCPCHPTYPAGHAGAAGSASALDDEFYLDTYLRREIFDTVYHRSMYRTFGAFHYAEDNLAGMKLAGMMEPKWLN